MPNALTKEEELLVIEKFKTQQYTRDELANKFNIRPNTILAILNRNGIQTTRSSWPKKYPLLEDFFNAIDSEYKAYFLGLLFADGYNGESRSVISLTLKKEDEHIISSFKINLKCNRPIKYTQINGYDVVRLDLYSKRMCRDLSNLGCVQNKTELIRFPPEENVSNNLVKHFIRGYFDGDGYIGLIKNRTDDNFSYGFSIASNSLFCLELSKYINEKLDINSVVYEHKTSKKISEIRINKKVEVVKFLDYIYKDAAIYLFRKYNKYQDILLDWQNNSPRANPKIPNLG